MKKGWEIRKLSEVVEKASSNISQNQLGNENGPYPIYGASGLIKNIGFYQRETDYISIVKDGAGIGRLGLQKAYSSVIGTLQYLIPKNEVDINYLYYFLLGIDFLKYKNGSTIPHIYFKDYSEELIQVPPLSVQKRIVSVIKEAFMAINKAKSSAERNLQNTRELFASFLYQRFNNNIGELEIKRLQEICILQRGFDLPAHSREIGPFPLVSSNGITDSISLWKIKGPGVVTGRSGTIGNIHFIEKDFWPLNTALYIKNFHNNDEKCVYYFLKQFNLGKYSSGAGVPTLNRNNVHSQWACFPKTITSQKRIAKELDHLFAETKKLESIYQQKIYDLEELKKSILEKAFKGELIKKELELQHE